MPSAATDSDRQAHLAARLYYVDGLAQGEVARRVNVSQAKVSRLLARAREAGIVRISVADYDPRAAELEAKLARSLGVASAIVIRVPAGIGADETRRNVGHFAAAPVLAALIGAKVLAIAGGRTPRELVRAMAETSPGLRKASPMLVQAMGSVTSRPGPDDAVELGRALAAAWATHFLTLTTPAFLADRRTRDALVKLEQVQQVLQALKDADAALVGIGTPAESVFVERDVLAKKDLARLQRDGAVGEVCGRFFDAAGRECDSLLRDRVVSVGLDDLRRTTNVIAAVVGADRAPAIVAAARGGIVKSLVTDDVTAQAVLAAASSRERKR
jgi:DNA-binding transcriptional regulator LsrR (DeoR family)